MGQKRGRDGKAQAVESKKRKKAAQAAPASDDGSWDGNVGIDDLNWKEVALPDRMEDAEGFFGLEEIDGVDIVRKSGVGEVQFKVRRIALRKPPPHQCVKHSLILTKNRPRRGNRRSLS